MQNLGFPNSLTKGSHVKNALVSPRNKNDQFEKQIIKEHQDEGLSSKGSATDSELDSVGDVSSDGGEYQNLPIIIDTPDGQGQIQVKNNTPGAETKRDSKTSSELNGYYDNLITDGSADQFTQQQRQK